MRAPFLGIAPYEYWHIGRHGHVFSARWSDWIIYSMLGKWGWVSFWGFFGALHFGVYNFVRKHHTLGTTPSVAAGLEEKPWSLERVVEMTADYMRRKDRG